MKLRRGKKKDSFDFLNQMRFDNFKILLTAHQPS